MKHRELMVEKYGTRLLLKVPHTAEALNDIQPKDEIWILETDDGV